MTIGPAARRRAALAAVAATPLLIGSERVSAQFLDTYLPAVVPGFDQSMGVTVLARPRPLYDTQGVRLGSLRLRGGLDESVGFDSNITGTRTGPSSPFIETHPALSLDSDWSRNRLGAAVSLDRFDYLSQPRQSYTDVNVAVGGGWTILRNTLDLGYAHVSGHEFGADAGAVAFNAPLSFDVDTVRSAYTLDLGRLSLTPNLDVRSYSYGSVPIDGVSVSQRFRDRVVVSGGVTTRWQLSDQRAVVLVVQGAEASYRHRQPGAPSNDSETVLVLPGIDYQASGPWRYRLLLGGEVRTFRAAQYKTQASPVAEASVTWLPTELTTVTAVLRRAIEDPQAEATSGYTYTGLQLTVDHELRRNVLLQATAGFGAVDYFQDGGHTRAYSFGGRATWLLTPNLSLFASYRFTHQDATNQRAGFGVGSLPRFTQDLALVGARWRL